MPDPNQKIGLVTGANRGIGLEIARRLGTLGIYVLMGARDPKRGQTAAAQLSSEHLDAEFVHLDVAHTDSIQESLDHIERHFGRLDILVNNAGIMIDSGGSILDVPLETFEAALRTNTFGPLLLGRGCVQLMKRNGYGRIVNISSTMGSLTRIASASDEEAALKSPSYRLSKTALNAVTVLLARELRGANILVNSACPGWVRTAMGGDRARLSAAEGADTPVWLATLPDGGPSGGFFRGREPIPW